MSSEESRNVKCRKNNWKMENVDKNLLRRIMDNVDKLGYNQPELNATVGIHYINIISIQT